MTKSKLVRDKIPKIITKGGEEPITHTATDKEYWQALLEKLEEEVREFKENPNEEELADILEIIYAIADYKSFTSLEKTRKRKAKERGGFKKRIIWEGNKK